ncbi:MAG: hypothetical protein IT177_05350 [Acidobacteria bacterium]|nr:hypothetical protein [Acidobacteriota bacterium]
MHKPRRASSASPKAGFARGSPTSSWAAFSTVQRALERILLLDVIPREPGLVWLAVEYVSSFA